MGRALALVYGVICYVVFWISLLYLIGFVGDFLVPRSIDAGPETPLGRALLRNAALLGLFAVQHSVMAREGFKRRWTRVVPPALERSTYVLLSSLLLLLLCWKWVPIPGVVWEVGQPAAALLWALYGAGWLIVLVSGATIDHLDLLGLRQAWLHFRGRAHAPPAFTVRGLYASLRHPTMAGFILAFWATPRMTVGHLLFAAVTTAYILLAIRFEERDLARFHGPIYREYRRRVWALLPLARWTGRDRDEGP